MELSTIQKRNKLNFVECGDIVGPGGAYHEYYITKENEHVPKSIIGRIQFQKGPRNQADSIVGILDTDLLEIVRHRLQCFQQGDYSTRENAIALTHIEEALLWMNKRVEDRAERGVLGTTNK